MPDSGPGEQAKAQTGPRTSLKHWHIMLQRHHEIYGEDSFKPKQAFKVPSNEQAQADHIRREIRALEKKLAKLLKVNCHLKISIDLKKSNSGK